MRVRERPSLRQTVEIVDPSGRRSYWAEDAPDPVDAFQDLSYSSVAPGGFATLDCKLMRKIAVAYADMAPFTTVRVRNASGGIDWEGRLERAARASGHEVSASPSAVGFQAALEDDKSVRALYVDRDLSRWRGPSTTRHLEIIDSSYSPTSPEVSSDIAAGPSLKLTATGAWVAAARPRAEAWYDSGGCPIDIVGVMFSVSPGVDLGDGNWAHAIGLLDADHSSGVGQQSSADIAAAGYVTVTATTATRRFALLTQSYAIAAGADGYDFSSFWTDVAVYGQHGLSVAPGPPPYGFWASQIIDHQIRTGFPTWQRRITPTSYAIAQAAYFEPTTRAEIVRDVNRFHVYDWFVWEGPLFEYRPRSQSGRRWRSRVGPAQLEETGPAADKMWRSVVVSYKDPDGSTRTAGPPGSGAQTIDSSLTTDGLDIPPDRVFHLPLNLAAPGAAIQAGQRFLYEANQVDRSGKAVQVGYVEDADTGILEPASHIRAGDVISYTDASDTSFRRINQPTWNRADRTASLELDSPAESLEAVVERLNAAVAGQAA